MRSRSGCRCPAPDKDLQNRHKGTEIPVLRAFLIFQVRILFVNTLYSTECRKNEIIKLGIYETVCRDKDMSFIEFENVSKVYQMGEVKINALSDVSFSIEKGEFVVVLGSSGAGKTTILNILGGMDTASSGTITVDGKQISSFNDSELCEYRRSDVGFVFQFYNLVQNLTARENVELAAQLCDDHMDSVFVLRMVGLEDRMNNFPSQLSGGEQQRVAIARAVAKNPKLLLCDEPTGALDYQTGKQVLRVLQDMCEKQNMTVVMITHNSALAEMGEKIIRVRSGRIESVTLNDNVKSIEEIEY